MSLLNKVKGIGRAVGIGGLSLILAAVPAKKADAADIRISGPTQFQSGQTYTLTLDAENTNLGGENTWAVEWRLNLPSYLSITNLSKSIYPTGAKPSAAEDFFEGKPMLDDNYLGSGSLSDRIVNASFAPVDKIWSKLAIYDVHVDYSGSLPKNDSLFLDAVTFYNPDGDPQWEPSSNPQFGFTITPEPASAGLLALGGLALLARRRKQGYGTTISGEDYNSARKEAARWTGKR